MRNTESVKARLKNSAVQSGLTFQETLTYYGLERTIYRISISKYADHFVLKGGIFLYAIYGRKFERATTDIDLLARRISNSSDKMKFVFQEILTQEVDDDLVFDINSVKAEDITEFKEYHGIHISATAFLDRTRIPVGIDIGFGDVIVPESIAMDFPVILDMEQPRVNVYSVESSVAEKLEAIVKNGYLNSRYKDFYDIYVLSFRYAFLYSKLKKAVEETFKNRKTQMTMNTAAFGEEFLTDSMHLSRWKSFMRKKRSLIQVSLTAVLDRIKTLAYPLLTETEMKPEKWDSENGRWI